MAEKSNVRKIVVAGVLGALSIALFLTPFGYIPWLAGASLTVMHVPAIIGAVLEGPVVGIVVGGIFGVTALIKAATAPQGPIDALLRQPAHLGPAEATRRSRRLGGLQGLPRQADGGRRGRRGHRGLPDQQRPRARRPRRLRGHPARGRRRRSSSRTASSRRPSPPSSPLAVVAAWKGIESRSGKAKLAKEA